MDLTELQQIAAREQAAEKPICIRCCTATGCQSSNALAVKQQLEASVKEQGLEDKVEVKGVGCMSLCGKGPLVEVEASPGKTLYQQVTPEQAPSIIAAIAGGLAQATVADHEHPFFTGQLQIARKYSGVIDPERIEDYIAVGGYQTLARVLQELKPAEVVDAIIQSGLRGRGGAGYPTGLKWATVAKSTGARKFVVCNGDEGDPGAFMDCSLLESLPHRVLEGMAIAAYAVGADQGYLYVRGEYPLAIARLQKAISQARRLGMLGSEIFDTGFNFRVDIRIGAGAFVCGEETALIASIEGGRGTPRPRPPYPAERGLWGCPTLINNVETFANIAPILEHGPEWYASFGTGASKGTKVFSLTGTINHTGLIEVPMGTSLRTVIEDMGGGAPDGAAIKAVQTGGPSGGCIPAELLDIPIDYDSLNRVGTIMGSGGMVVMDDRTSMVDVAHFYMEFCMDESCGKCIPCRAGTKQLHGLLSKIRAGQATQADLTTMEELCAMVKTTSLCGLGQSAPNPVLSTLRYFRHEYEALLQDVHEPDEVLSHGS